MSEKFGNHSQLLDEVIQWENELKGKFPGMDPPTRLYLELDWKGLSNYYCTPVDAVRFANTGGDGIHYAFLTDFGSNLNLDECPIICVEPMDPTKTRLVAKNLFDFLSLQLLGAEDLLSNHFTSEEAYIDYLENGREQMEISSYFDYASWEANTLAVGELAKERFALEPISSPFSYWAELRAERERMIVIPTNEGLGVIQPDMSSPATADRHRHPWFGQEIPFQDCGAIAHFLNTEKDSAVKLGFIRDYQLDCITDRPTMELICNELERMNHYVEAERMRNIYEPLITETKGMVTIWGAGLIMVSSKDTHE